MTFRLSQRSLQRLEGVKPQLVRVVHEAINITSVDFGVIEGVRTPQRQAELLAAGNKTQTENSKHLTGDAVDLAAFIGASIDWDNLNLYAAIADAMKAAATKERVKMRWGAAWHINDMRDWKGTMKAAMDDYVRVRRSQGRQPFIDAVHFELM
jgi:peptidoglycan LD-endopeptidase CwlK